MSKTKLQKTPWGFRPSHWKILPWNSFATPSGEPITVAPDSKAKQVTVRVRHKGVVERRTKRNQPRVIRNPNQTQISAGQFIISRIDARNGACGIVPKELDGAIVTKDFRVFDIDSTIVHTSYLDYLIGLPIFWKLCSFVSDGTTNRVRLDMELFDQMSFPIPPLIEQEIAVNTLQSIDDILKRTEYVIIKAEQLLDALLNKLLTRGLPGHHKEKWERVTLKTVASLRKDYLVPSKQDQRPYIGLEYIGSNGVLLGSGKACDTKSQKSKFFVHDILYGKLRPNLRKIARATFDGVCSTDILVIYGHTQIDSRFLQLILRGEPAYKHALRGVAGTRMPRTSWGHLSDFEFDWPSLNERTKTVELFDKFDRVIELNRVTKNQLFLLSQATSNTLLTGQIQLHQGQARI